MLVPTSLSRAANELLWKRGRSLEQASWELSPQDLHQRYIDLSDPKCVQVQNERIKQVTREQLDASLALNLALGVDLIQAVMAPSAVRGEMRDWLRQALGDGKFVAYGDRTPVNIDSDPNLIPGEFFLSGKVSWWNSSLKVGGSEFISIRIFRKKWLKQVKTIGTEPIASATAAPKKIGRPSRAKAARRAIELLVPQSPTSADFFSKPFVDSIRKYVVANDVGHDGKRPDWGLSVQVIKRELRAYFERQKVDQN